MKKSMQRNQTIMNEFHDKQENWRFKQFTEKRHKEATKFDFAITRSETEHFLVKSKIDAIMCKKSGDNDNWVKVNNVEALNENYKFFEISFSQEEKNANDKVIYNTLRYLFGLN